MDNDRYRASAVALELLSTLHHPTQFAALEETLPRFQPEIGPILDIGAGSGAISARVIEALPTAKIVALEPSAAMRSLFIGRVAEHPEWHSRITVWPEAFFDAGLPDATGGAIILGAIGHFDTGERLALLAELARRMPPRVQPC